MDENICDICGYTTPSHSSVVVKYPDGMFRCRVCADVAAHGRFIPEYEVRKASKARVKAWTKEFSEWMKLLAD